VRPAIRASIKSPAMPSTALYLRTAISYVASPAAACWAVKPRSPGVHLTLAALERGRYGEGVNLGRFRAEIGPLRLLCLVRRRRVASGQIAPPVPKPPSRLPIRIDHAAQSVIDSSNPFRE
jgi:hypothetical protein